MCLVLTVKNDQNAFFGWVWKFHHRYQFAHLELFEALIDVLGKAVCLLIHHGLHFTRLLQGGFLSTKKCPTFKTIQKLQPINLQMKKMLVPFLSDSRAFYGFSSLFLICLLCNNFGGIFLHISQDLREVRR